MIRLEVLEVIQGLGRSHRPVVPVERSSSACCLKKAVNIASQGRASKNAMSRVVQQVRKLRAGHPVNPLHFGRAMTLSTVTPCNQDCFPGAALVA